MNKYPRFSVIIITASRRTHLYWTLKAIKESNIQPVEVILVHMDNLNDFPNIGIHVKQYRLKSDHNLPLAAARNLGASKAACDNLIFLDVDCIPDKYCFARLIAKLTIGNVVQGTPRYLTRKIKNLKYLGQKSLTHPLKIDVDPYIKQEDYNQFWSLVFAIRKSDFLEVEGFCENYTGYGAEDTDFAQKLKFHGLELWRVNAFVYHQYHRVYRPPLNHFNAILNNATLFYERWGYFPMIDWLREFEDYDLIRIKKRKLKIIRNPNTKEISMSKSEKAF